jgi:hypothetical protein
MFDDPRTQAVGPTASSAPLPATRAAQTAPRVHQNFWLEFWMNLRFCLGAVCF